MDRRLAEAGPLSRRDHALYAGSRAHYEDPRYYDHAYARRRDDVRFYVTLATRYGGPVLEYGVGNGRIALPIARQGVPVVGIDSSQPMIADLRRRVAKDTRLRNATPGRADRGARSTKNAGRGARPDDERVPVSARLGDMRSVRLGRRFPLVLSTFNTLLHLYDRRDFDRFFARVREHMAPDGRFVFDVSTPQPEQLARDPNRAYRSRPFRHPTRGVTVDYIERFEYEKARQILFVWMEFVPQAKRGRTTRGALSESWVTPLAHRQIFPQELEALLALGGFAVERLEGDFSGGPFTPESDVMVVTCRRG